MEVKTNVFLSESDIRAIIKKHLEKTGYKVIGELEIIVKSQIDRNIKQKGLEKADKIGISAEVQKLFKNRINLAKKE
jgi:hypothetical protein